MKNLLVTGVTVLVRVTAVVLTRANQWIFRLRGPTSRSVLKAQLDQDCGLILGVLTVEVC